MSANSQDRASSSVTGPKVICPAKLAYQEKPPADLTAFWLALLRAVGAWNC